MLAARAGRGIGVAHAPARSPSAVTIATSEAPLQLALFTWVPTLETTSGRREGYVNRDGKRGRTRRARARALPGLVNTRLGMASAARAWAKARMLASAAGSSAAHEMLRK